VIYFAPYKARQELKGDRCDPLPVRSDIEDGCDLTLLAQRFEGVHNDPTGQHIRNPPTDKGGPSFHPKLIFDDEDAAPAWSIFSGVLSCRLSAEV
jgi:hypothetical protein